MELEWFFPLAQLKQAEELLIMQLAGNLNRQQTYTPPLLVAILMLASLRSFSVNFRTFNMKKNYYFVFLCL